MSSSFFIGSNDIFRYYDNSNSLPMDGLLSAPIFSLMREQGKIWQDVGRTTLATNDGDEVRAFQCTFTNTVYLVDEDDDYYGTLKNLGNDIWALTNYESFNGTRFFDPVRVEDMGTSIIVFQNGVVSFNINNVPNERIYVQKPIISLIVYNKLLSGNEINRIKKFSKVMDNFAQETEISSLFYNTLNMINSPLINTSKCINLNNLFEGCSSLKYVQLLDTKSVQSVGYMFSDCLSLKTIPAIDTSNCTNFAGICRNCSSLEYFPLIDTSKGNDFFSAWANCSKLKSFPALDFSGVKANIFFQQAWFNCASLKSFPANVFDKCKSKIYSEAFSNCALDQTSVDNILVSLALSAQTFNNFNGTIDINGGTNATPGPAGIVDRNALIARNWTVRVN